MKSRQSSERLFVLLLLVCCYQKNWAGMAVKESKAKNYATARNQTTKPPRMVHKIKTTATTTIADKHELETTTLPTDFDLDGRNAFINNKFVSEEKESTSHASPALRNPLQPQIQTVQTNKDTNFQDYENISPHIQEALDYDHVETQNLPKKPILNYDMSQFDDYEEEETSENDDIPENCEDTEESLGDNDEEENGDDEAADFTLKQEETLYNAELNMFKQTFQNNYNQETNENEGLSHETPLSQYVYETTKPIRQQNHNNNNGGIKQATKSKPVDQYQTQTYYGYTIRNEPQQVFTNKYVQTNPLQHNGYTNQNSYDKSKIQQYLKPHYNIEKSPQPLLNSQKPTQNSKLHTKQQTILQYNKPGNSFYNKRLHNSTLLNYFNNHTQSLSQSGNFNSDNFSLGDSKTVTSSPFSSTSAQNKKFKTVSSSVQYVSTPLADLVFKYSIGVAKHTNVKVANNSSDNKAHVFIIKNDINGKTE